MSTGHCRAEFPLVCFDPLSNNPRHRSLLPRKAHTLHPSRIGDNRLGTCLCMGYPPPLAFYSSTWQFSMVQVVGGIFLSEHWDRPYPLSLYFEFTVALFISA